MDKEEYGIELNLLIDKFKSKMAQVQNYFKNFSSNAKNDVDIGLNVSKAQDKIRELEKNIENYERIIEKLNKKGITGGGTVEYLENKIKTAKNGIEKLNNAIKSTTQSPISVFTTFFTNLKNIFKKTEESTKEVKDDVEEIGEKGQNAGNGLGNAFTKGTKSLKRFALSLFGIQSIWRVLSRASSAYMQQNKELSSKIQGVWNALGTLVGPVIDALANVFMKLLGYINVVTKALFNFDFIAKANANTLKNYQKQASKTGKALATIDELQNLNQQTNQDEGPQGLLEVPELNQKVVKFLEDVSKALKDNWDWLQYVLLGFGAVFGASAIAGWLGNIGKLLGFAGASGAGGAGLLGLASTLAWIGGLGVLAVEIAIIYKYAKDVKEADDAEIEATDTLLNLHKKGTKIMQEHSEQGYKKGSVEQNKYIAFLKDEISTNATLIKDNQEKISSYTLFEKEMAMLTGKYAENKLAIQESEKEIDKLIGLFQKEYEQGNLTADQEEYYLELLKTRNETIKYSDGLFEKTAKNYAGLTEKNIDHTIKWKNKTEDLGIAIKTAGDAITNATNKDYKVKLDDSKVQKEPSVVQAMKNSINEVLKSPFELIIETKMKGPTQQNVSSLVSGLTGGANAIANALGLNGNIVTAMKNPINQAIDNINAVFSRMGLPKISKLAIGTDLVKSDGLAYIHKGEQVVPADVVKGGYTGTNNEETNNLLRQLIDTLENKEFNASIGQDEVGRASVNYIRKQNRIMGGSVI